MLKIEIRPIAITLHKKTKSKWIKDLNTKHELLKLLKENLGSSLHNVGKREGFLNRTSSAKE